MEGMNAASINEFEGKKFKAEDGSVIYFAEDGSFLWYRSDDNHEDNYYRGTYELRFAKDGMDYIIKELPQFGMTEQKMALYLSRNKESEFYRLRNFCFLSLNNEELKADGESRQLQSVKSYYMGFYAEGLFDAANMQTGNYVKFSRG